MTLVNTLAHDTDDALVEALTVRPAALLLDFGGVVFSTRKRSNGLATLADEVADVLTRAGHTARGEELMPVLEGGISALKHWKHAQSRRPAPGELDHKTLWQEFYAAPLPPAQREVLAGSAGHLQHLLTHTLAGHEVRPGIPELLELCRGLGVPVGIVSNAHSGRAHRDILRRHGLQDYFAVQVYSDEVGMRKPHPGIIELAARALGTEPAQCWYVGDTQDRDVAGARRAEAGGVILTRDRHTDRPPFPVLERADLVLESPAGIVPLLAAAGPGPLPPTSAHRQRAARSGASDSRPLSALLLDHGGVISVSVPDEQARRGFAALLADKLTRAGYPTDTQTAADAIAEARIRHRAWKSAHEAAQGPVTDADFSLPEIDAATFWTELVGPSFAHHGPGAHDWLRAECHELMRHYARSKSLPRLRPGVRELLQRAEQAGVPVAIVSNTVCGRAVREELIDAGIDRYIAAHVYSDELGRRKPDPATVRSALTALDAEPSRACFIGDKPHRDARAAHAAGIGTIVLVRGGATSDQELEHLADTAGHIVTSMTEVIPLLFP